MSPGEELVSEQRKREETAKTWKTGKGQPFSAVFSLEAPPPQLPALLTPPLAIAKQARCEASYFALVEPQEKEITRLQD